ncbi:MAG: ABC transporter permease [Spirochaetales bacterium]|nr:ABC transporter permease [Spirochaetales bacterium]
MKNHNFKFRIYAGKKLAERKSGASVFAALFAGIAGSFAVLIVVIGVMNGFQDNYITRRIEIASYHAVIRPVNDKLGYVYDKAVVEYLYRNVPEIEAAVPFCDRDILILFRNKIDSDRQPVKLRAIDAEEMQKDSRFLELFSITHGKLDLCDNKVILGEELGWRELSFARLNSPVYLTPDISLQTLAGRKEKEAEEFRVGGYFNTGSYDYDRYWAFVSLSSFFGLTGTNQIDGIGLKFKKKVNRRTAAEKIRSLPELEKYGLEIKTAEEINSAYFAALRLEKTMILFLFVIIFFMVAVNIFGTLRLVILEKKEKILILKALGAMPRDVEHIFLFESLILAFGASAVGLLAGTFISYNILAIFAVVECIINSALRIAVPTDFFKPLVIYDTSIYYQTDFLVKFTFAELAAMFFLIVLLTLLSAYIPVAKAARLRPNKILQEPL